MPRKKSEPAQLLLTESNDSMEPATVVVEEEPVLPEIQPLEIQDVGTAVEEDRIATYGEEEKFIPSQPTPQEESPDKAKNFFDLDFHELDRDLTDAEKQDWNNIYASFRSKSVMTGTVAGINRHQVGQETIYCAMVLPHRIPILIPSAEMWTDGDERPDFVLRNMVGATIDFVVTVVDREAEFAVGSRKRATRNRRYYLSRHPELNQPGTKTTCQVLAVGPRRTLVSCYGYDIDLTQRELQYTSVPDLRTHYHPGDKLPCIIKSLKNDILTISVKETTSNPFDNAHLRHPVGSNRQAVIAGKYAGGVFCNLPDGAVCFCAYRFHYMDQDFRIGETVVISILRHDTDKKQIYGKILAKRF